MVFSDPNDPNILIRPARCNEPEATKRFSFTGNLDKSGKISGEGVVTADEGLPEQSKCIKFGKLFGIRIKSVRSKFTNGLANSTTFITFEDDVYQQAEVLVDDGAVRGLFRVEADNWWSLGTVANGLVDGTCVFNYPNYVSI